MPGDARAAAARLGDGEGCRGGRLRRAGAGRVAAVALLLFGSGATLAPSLASAAPPGSGVSAPEGERAERGERGPTRYLVAPLLNRSSSAGLGWMSAALSQTVAEKLEAHPGLRPAYGPQVLLGLQPMDSEGGAEVLRRAREVGAQWIVSGHFNRVAWRYQIGLRLQLVTPRGLQEVARSEATAPSASAGNTVLLDLLDQALLELLDRAGLPPEPSPRQAILRRPTKDVYALTLYGRALHGYYQAWQSWQASPGGQAQGAAPAPPGAQGGPDRGELDKAQKTLLRVCFIDPKFAEAHRMLGLIHQELGEAGKAMGQYAHALDLRPDYHAALAGLGRLQRQAGQRARAQETFERTLQVRPWDTESRLQLGELLWEGGQLAEAQGELLKVVAERPDHLAARRALAGVYAARGQSEQLAAELLRVQALAPDDIDVRMDLGAAYARLGKLRPAIAVYEEIIQRRPRHAEAYRLLGDLYRRVGEGERAQAAYQRLLRLQPDEARSYFLLSAAQLDLGQDARAEQTLQDAQQFRRYLGEAWTNLGALALRRGDLVRASWYLSRAAARQNARPRAHYNYALLLDRTNQPDKALQELKLAADLDPQDAEVRFAAGVMLLRQGREGDAQRAFAEALQIQPDHPGARHNLELLKE